MFYKNKFYIMKKKMIKIGIRHNLIYPLMLLIFSSLREILSIIIKEKIKFDESLLLNMSCFYQNLFQD